MKGYTLLDLNTKKTFTTRIMFFHEHIFPHTTQSYFSYCSRTYYPNSSFDQAITTISHNNEYIQDSNHATQSHSSSPSNPTLHDIHVTRPVSPASNTNTQFEFLRELHTSHLIYSTVYAPRLKT